MEIAGQRGILVTGGYYNGVSSMFLPLEDRGGRSLETFGSERNMPRWEYVGGLTKVNLKILIFKIIFIDCSPSFRFFNWCIILSPSVSKVQVSLESRAFKIFLKHT